MYPKLPVYPKLPKVGFHCGPGGNRNGLTENYVLPVQAAGIPAAVKSVDDYGPCFVTAQHAISSGVAHQVVFRLSTVGQGGYYNYDVPNYDATPLAAAQLHWAKTLERLPPELKSSPAHKSVVWVEVCNEVDKNRSDWIGEFGVSIATIANGQGYKVLLPGWSSGEPEPEHWKLLA